MYTKNKAVKIIISDTIDEVLASLAEYFIASANDSILKNGSFTVALSGGTSPKRFYSLLTTTPYKERVDWTKLFFFFGDERYVPATNPASNFQMVKKVLFEPLDIDMSRVFPVNTTLAPNDAALQYTNDIKQYFKGDEPIFDLVLLGLGDNSHTASLFPHTGILQEQEAAVKAVFLTDQQVYRISFTAPLINLAPRIAFLVYGEAKSAAVYNVLEGNGDPENYPAQLIQTEKGDVQWFIDRAAAAKLKNAAES